jgi:hypothetical protein
MAEKDYFGVARTREVRRVVESIGHIAELGRSATTDELLTELGHIYRQLHAVTTILVPEVPASQFCDEASIAAHEPTTQEA